MKEEMWQIYRKYYHYSKASFMERIASNNYYALYYQGRQLVGFTGLRINQFRFEGKRHLLMYFGQTVIERIHRGKSLIARTGAKLCLKYLPQILTSKTYFWCDALTYKAYLVVAKTLDECYPSRKAEMPPAIKRLKDHIGKMYYGAAYCPQSGTVKKAVKYVNDFTTEVRQKDKQDADVRFYLQQNPLHVQGHGLLALGPVNWSNFWLLMQRLFGGFSRKRKPSAPLPQVAMG
ncbi:MAG: hypothetical protein D6730_04965 [Bacteroidetes bacterium]|nr:MAG: hypothetical protein D6730_04965 [Bacteroidota bacterium]